MENASDALKMAFACLVFVIALTSAFSLISKIRETADTILYYSDNTKYYDWTGGSSKDGRTVDEDTVIASIYNADKDLTRVFVYEKNGKKIYPSTTKDKQEIINNDLNENIQYKEKVVEITTGGKYIIAEDGTQILVEKGSSVVYIYYTATK